MLYRRQGNENPSRVNDPTQANPQQTYVNPAFEAQSGIQAQSGPTPVEGPTSRALSPFEIQQREQQLPSVGGTVNAGPSGQPVASPFQAPSATPVQRPSAPLVPQQQFLQPTPMAQVGQPASMIPTQFGSPQTHIQAGTPQTPQLASTPQITSPVQQQAATIGQQPSTFEQPSIELTGPGLETGGMQARQPPMDVHDVGDELEIEIELPGVSKSDISLTGQANGLRLNAIETSRETDDLVRSERGQRFFKREIPLGYEVDPKKVSARFQNGILTVSVPKEPAGQSTIEIK